MNRLVSLASLLILTCAAIAQPNAIPVLYQPLSPANASPGSGAFSLTVSGTGFVSGATVYWNGSARATTFASASKVSAAILATDVAKASTASVTVVNPAPGGGTSNVVYFTIGFPATLVALTDKAFTDSQNAPDGSVVGADVNHDGKVDIVSSMYSPGGLITLLGNGDGTFQTPIVSAGTQECGLAPGAIVAGDFNNDGNLDVLEISLLNEFCILLGNGDGTFRSGPLVNLGSEFFGVTPVLGDFNGDGNLDIAVTVDGYNNVLVEVFLGNGDGTMQAPVQYSAGFPNNGSQYLAMGDFNGDGKLDLIAAGDGIAILLGNGDGTFQPGVAISSGVEFPAAMAVADFNGDGHLDVAVSENYAYSLAVLMGNGDGTFQAAVDYPINFDSLCTVVADFNNDGKLDLGCSGGITSANVSYSTSILLGNGDGSFQPHMDYIGQYVSAPASVVGADFNNDGLFDLTGTAPYYIDTFLQTTLQASPGSLDFPVQSIGTTSKVEKVILTNSGKTHLGLAIQITGTNAADFGQKNTCGKGLNPGQQCTIGVTMTPSQPYSESAAISITDNAVGSPQTIALSGRSTAYLFSAKGLNFGDVAIGQSSQQTVTLTNAWSGGSVAVGEIEFYGSGSAAFSQTNNCPHNLAALQSCQINVTFQPSTTGTINANLNIFAVPVNVYVYGVGTGTPRRP